MGMMKSFEHSVLQEGEEMSEMKFYSDFVAQSLPVVLLGYCKSWQIY